MAKLEENDELLKYIKCKLVKNNAKIEKVANWFDDKDELGGEIGEALTIGTEENTKVLTLSSIIPGAAFAIGLASALVGLFVIAPSTFEPVNEAERMAFPLIKDAGNKILSFSASSFDVGIKSAIAPLGISAISLPKYLIRVLADKFYEKTDPIVIENEKVVELIDDFMADKDDPSIEFFKVFLKRVNLSDNKEKFNLELLKNFAYFRNLVQSYEKRKIEEKEVIHQFLYIIEFLRDAMDSNEVSRSFKRNRFLRVLVNDYSLMEEYYDKSFKSK